jgi:hypothetical protein
MRDASSPTGRLTIRLVDPRTGRVTLEQRAKNLVTLAGRQVLADLFRGITDVRPPAPVWIVVGGALGVVPTAPALGDTALQNPQLTVDATFESSLAQDVDGALRIVTTLMGTLEADPGSPVLTLTEAGVQLNPEGSTPVLYNRVVFGPITKAADLQMTLSWEVIF